MNVPNLPILERRSEILKAIRENQVVVIYGETGSGKTTQIPIFLLEAGYGELGIIGVTEPRRIAATSIAPYVKTLLPEEEAKQVGYKIRFADTTDDRTKVKFMTDGILLEEGLHDLSLGKYSVIMIDEAHERSENIDFLLGLLKRLLPTRPDLRVIIASATIDTHKFSEFFGNAPIIEVSGRMYPVEIRWGAPHFGEHFNPRLAPQEVAETVLSIHRHEGEGDILAFLPGKDDIAQVMEILTTKGASGLELLPAYGRMDIVDQNAIFLEYPGKRKVILATNVAETSITPAGVRFIVDPGLIKEMSFKPGSGLQKLKVVPHSRSGLDQRAGRAGRTQSGVCYRLYSKEEYEAQPLYTVPEICRSSLASIILKMYFLGIYDIPNFDFIDRPHFGLFREAHESLRAFGALDGNNVLTAHGKRMAELPLDPYIAQLLLTAVRHKCVDEMITISAFLSAQNVLLRPPGEEDAADKAHKVFESPVSDAFTSLAIWKAYEKHVGNIEWCRTNYLNEKALEEVADVRNDLRKTLGTFGIAVTSTANEGEINKAIVSALINRLYRRSSRGKSYYPINTGDREVFIHPGSSVYKGLPEFVVAGEVVETTKCYMRFCTQVDPRWLFSLGVQLKEEKKEREELRRGDRKNRDGSHKKPHGNKPHQSHNNKSKTKAKPSHGQKRNNRR